VPLNLVSPFFQSGPGRALHALLVAVTRLMPALLGYQFVIYASLCNQSSDLKNNENSLTET
jgi:hypothetical protein